MKSEDPRQQHAEGAVVALWHPKREARSQVSVRIGLDGGRGRWTADVISCYLELEYFIWRHAAAQKAGVKGAAAREEA